MATRGRIAIKENGKYRYIYNHYDSYLDNLGVTLFKFYKDADKVRELINLGNVSSVGETVENTATCYKEHMDLDNQHKGTVAFFREGRNWTDFDYYNPDESWEDCKPTEVDTLEEVLDVENVLGEEFVYIFDVEKNKWYMAYNRDGFELKDLDVILHTSENVKRYAELIGIAPQYQQKFCDRCLNA